MGILAIFQIPTMEGYMETKFTANVLFHETVKLRDRDSTLYA